MDENLNRKLHEAMGRCIAEWPDESTLAKCLRCGKHRSQHTNPSYDTDLNAAMEAVEWMRREKGYSAHINADSEGVWYVEFGTRNDPTDDESLPRAITTAILSALEGEK